MSRSRRATARPEHGARTTAAAATTGLTSAEVAQRVAAGLDNQVPDPNSRSFASILSANTFTYFNLLIGVPVGADARERPADRLAVRARSS